MVLMFETLTIDTTANKGWHGADHRGAIMDRKKQPVKAERKGNREGMKTRHQRIRRTCNMRRSSCFAQSDEVATALIFFPRGGRGIDL